MICCSHGKIITPHHSSTSRGCECADKYKTSTVHTIKQHALHAAAATDFSHSAGCTFNLNILQSESARLSWNYCLFREVNRTQLEPYWTLLSHRQQNLFSFAAAAVLDNFTLIYIVLWSFFLSGYTRGKATRLSANDYALIWDEWGRILTYKLLSNETGINLITSGICNLQRAQWNAQLIILEHFSFSSVDLSGR